MEKILSKVTIVGLGLLGGSIGLGIKKRKLAKNVSGCFRDPAKISLAKKMGAIDEGCLNLKEAMSGSELVILATPVQEILNKIAEIKKIKEFSGIITDVGSTKSLILKTASGLRFIGSHPLAGSEKQGIKNARKDLFCNSLCILTPQKNFAPGDLKLVGSFWQDLGSHCVTMDAIEHDRILALTSHLPHVLSYLLAASIPGKDARFSGASLKDLTRIALSSPELWATIFSSNKKYLLSAISVFEKQLASFKTALLKKDQKKLLHILKNSKQSRERWKIDP